MSDTVKAIILTCDNCFTEEELVEELVTDHGAKVIELTQLWEPIEAHREEGDNELVATWGFGTSANAQIPGLWLIMEGENE